MTTGKKLFIALTFIMIVFVNSCKKSGDDAGYTYYISKELHSSYTQNYIISVAELAAEFYPGVEDLSQYITGGADLYKIVYESTIDGRKEMLSGIVCVPGEPGEYPVISFQNGTNTLDRNAPSEFPPDKGFQLLQVISSMGYVIVIADYPGFGESSELPHPYLVAEPTIRSLVDLLYAVREMDQELPEIQIKNEYYVMGYSQGGWATLLLHKALEQEYNSDFDLRAGICGAGPYNIYGLMERMFEQDEFPMPYYIGYVIDGYKSYHQFTNPVSDILNEPYDSRIENLFAGQYSSGQINSELTTTISDLVKPEFLDGFNTSAQYASIREAMVRNSISPWRTQIPLYLFHGDADTHVLPIATDDMYNGMINAGTSEDIIKKIIIPGADHAEGVVPTLIEGFIYINNLKNSGR